MHAAHNPHLKREPLHRFQLRLHLVSSHLGSQVFEVTRWTCSEGHFANALRTEAQKAAACQKLYRILRVDGDLLNYAPSVMLRKIEVVSVNLQTSAKHNLCKGRLYYQQDAWKCHTFDGMHVHLRWGETMLPGLKGCKCYLSYREARFRAVRFARRVDDQRTRRSEPLSSAHRG